MPFDQRLPIIDSDDGSWGHILNQYINKEHYDTGLDDPLNGTHKTITIRPGTATAGTAPLTLNSGPLLTGPEVGAVEFLSDRLYFTQTTGATRKVVAAFDDSFGATGDLYYRDASGNFIRLPGGTAGQILTVNAGVPSWQSKFNGTSSITVGVTAPSSPATGDIWVDTN